MALADKPVTLTAEEVAELHKKLSKIRHDINGDLALIMAALELVRLKPDSMTHWIPKLSEVPAKIKGSLTQFSAEFEKALGIKPENPAPGDAPTRRV
jgi:hypothetical protein